MSKVLTALALAALLLAGCDTTDWMADEDSYTPNYVTSDQADPSSSDPVIDHERAVQRQNCADYYAGHNVVCND